MKNRYYPVFLDGNHLECLVVGGGVVAERKVAALCQTGALVMVVSPDLTPRLHAMAKRGAVEWVQGGYRKSLLKGKNLVVGATDDRKVNECVFIDSKKAGIIVNIVDDPVRCTFIVPSTFSKGPLCVAVSTGGAAPTLAARIRAEIEANVPDEYIVLLTEAKKLRPRLKEFSPEQKKCFWSHVSILQIAEYKGEPAKLRRWVRTRFRDCQMCTRWKTRNQKKSTCE